MFRAKIYPEKYICYMDNIRASVTNCMSDVECTQHYIVHCQLLYTDCSVHFTILCTTLCFLLHTSLWIELEKVRVGANHSFNRALTLSSLIM